MENGKENKTGYRVEQDSIGAKDIPGDVYYGVQSLRAAENFRITGLNMHPEIINSLAYIKKASAITNCESGILEKKKAKAIVQACDEILTGKLHEYFIVDPIQGGAGTSLNMNANEVIANRALEIMGHQRGEYTYCSPNDHVNRSQSTNDAYPTAIHLGMYATHLQLLPYLEALIASFRKKGEEFAHIIKMGRTQLEDAVPMTLGQTFNGFASILQDEIAHLDHAANDFLTVNMGATAIGTGICAEPGYAEKCIEALRQITGWDIKLSADLVGATSDTSCLVGYAAAMKRVAVKINKICNDLRLLASGPRCGIGEIIIPENEPGSSIMPGKVNPTQCEAVTMVAVQVMGNDVAVSMAASQGNFELNVFMPVCIYNFLQSARLLAESIVSFNDRCAVGIRANREKMEHNLHNSLMLVTALNPYIGYENAAKTAKKAYKENISLKEACVSLGFLTAERFDEVFHPENMI